MPELKEAVLVTSRRSAVGKGGRGSLRSTWPDDFAAQVIKDTLTGLPKLPLEAIDDVITATRAQAAELRQEMLPRVRDLMDEALEEIEQILTPEQREAYDRLRRFQRRGLEMLVLGPGGPGGPRGGPQRRGRRHGPPF